MKKNIGNVNAAFPTPIVVVGSITDGKPSWFEVAWIGIGDQDIVTLSVTPSHHTCKGIMEHKVLSIALVNEKILDRADYVGIVSGNKVDKSEVFQWKKGELGAPLIDDADVIMECELIDTYNKHGMNLLVCRVKNTYADNSILDSKDKIDYNRFKPVLFEPGFNYLTTGQMISPCIKPGKEFAKKL